MNQKIFKNITIIIALLVLAHIVFQAVRFLTGHDEVFGLATLFHLDREFNVPSFFSMSLLLIAAFLFWLIGSFEYGKKPSFFWQWHLLGWAFAWLSMDEFFSFHEQWADTLRNTFHTSGFLYYIWQLPYLIVLIVLLVLFIPFIKQMNCKIRFQMFIAGGIYLTGVVVLESLQGWYFSINPDGGSVPYFFLTTIEEACEMMGINILIYALLNQMVLVGKPIESIFKRI